MDSANLIPSSASTAAVGAPGRVAEHVVPTDESTFPRAVGIAAGILIVAALILWWVSLPAIHPERMNDLGLVSVLPPVYFLALAAVVVSFSVTVHYAGAPRWLLLLQVLILIVILQATLPIVYGSLRYAWAWKHVGIVDYFQRHGRVDPLVSVTYHNPTIAYLDIYQSWPGFFAFAALLTNAAGLHSALPYAPWATLFFDVAYLGGLLLILPELTRDSRLVWLAVWFYFLGNWIGQDYFSPQSLCYFLFLVIVGLCLRYFGKSGVPVWWGTVRHLLPRRLRGIKSLLEFGPTGVRAETSVRGWQRLVLFAFILLLFFAVVSAHQLTPFATLAAVTVLVVFRRCRLLVLPLIMAAMTIFWVFVVAAPFVHQNAGLLFGALFNLGGNVAGSVHNLSNVSAEHRFTSYVSRALTAAMVTLGIIGALRAFRRGYRDISPALLVLAPVPIVGASSYGSEVLFRVYFFALPFLAFFAAAAFFPSLVSGLSWRTSGVVMLVSGTLLGAFLFSYLGKEQRTYFPGDEVAASYFLQRVAPPGSLIVRADDNYPTVFRDYERYTYFSIVDPFRHDNTTQRVLHNPARTLAAIMAGRPRPASYVILTHGQKEQVSIEGLLPSGALNQVQRRLARSPRFKVIYASPDAEIFQLRHQPTGARRSGS